MSCCCTAEDDARRLLDLLSDVYCMVNLIVFNPHEGTRFQRSDDEQVRQKSRLTILRLLSSCVSVLSGYQLRIHAAGIAATKCILGLFATYACSAWFLAGYCCASLLLLLSLLLADVMYSVLIFGLLIILAVTEALPPDQHEALSFCKCCTVLNSTPCC
jgi:hypothetical protein